MSIFADLMAGYDATDTMRYPVELGFTETGQALTLDLKAMKHVLISGMSQSGKSTMVRKLLPSLVEHADVAIYSTKDSDFVDYAGKAYVCGGLAQISTLVRRTVGEVERRNDRLREARRERGVAVSCDEKPVVVLIDEFQSFAEMADAPTMVALKRIIREGAGLNVFIYIITQTPTKRALSDGLRDNIMTDIAFKQRDASSSRMALGTREAEFLELHQCVVRFVATKYKLTRFSLGEPTHIAGGNQGGVERGSADLAVDEISVAAPIAADVDQVEPVTVELGKAIKRVQTDIPNFRARTNPAIRTARKRRNGKIKR